MQIYALLVQQTYGYFFMIFVITFVEKVLLTGFDTSDVDLLAPLHKSLWLKQLGLVVTFIYTLCVVTHLFQIEMVAKRIS